MANTNIQLPTPRLYVWQQGGGMGNLTLADAVQYVEDQRTKRNYQWEVRTPGKECETDWDGHPTLEAAVNAALPNWAEIGLSWEQAALVAIDAGLVLSTGAEVEEDDPIKIRVEYDLAYFGGDYDRTGDFVTVDCANEHQPTVEAAFRVATGHDPCHIIHWGVVEDDELDIEPIPEGTGGICWRCHQYVEASEASDHICRSSADEPDAHRRNPGFCAQCGGPCYFDDEGRRVIKNQGQD